MLYLLWLGFLLALFILFSWLFRYVFFCRFRYCLKRRDGFILLLIAYIFTNIAKSVILLSVSILWWGDAAYNIILFNKVFNLFYFSLWMVIYFFYFFLSFQLCLISNLPLGIFSSRLSLLFLIAGTCIRSELMASLISFIKNMNNFLADASSCLFLIVFSFNSHVILVESQSFFI